MAPGEALMVNLGEINMQPSTIAMHIKLREAKETASRSIEALY